MFFYLPDSFLRPHDENHKKHKNQRCHKVFFILKLPPNPSNLLALTTNYDYSVRSCLIAHTLKAGTHTGHKARAWHSLFICMLNHLTVYFGRISEYLEDCITQLRVQPLSSGALKQQGCLLCHQGYSGMQKNNKYIPGWPLFKHKHYSLGRPL